jgi:hypothetical protein
MGGTGNDDYALVEDDEFDGEETPRIRKNGWGPEVQALYFDEEGEREREREFLEALRYVVSTFVFLSTLGFAHGWLMATGALTLKPTRTTTTVEASADGV